MARKKKQPKKLAVFDIETDPFLYGREPRPFCLGFFDGELYREWWGPDCVARFIEFLAECEQPYIIYAHNGGKFDFFYLLRDGVIENPIKIINGRIVKAKIGIHELRDSYAIIPVPLAAYQKDSIDYQLFEADKREANKNEILHYLAKDCEYLFELVARFVDRFGYQLTIGGTAIKQLQEFHPFPIGGRAHDDRFRPFYFGGRVSTFEMGELKGAFKVFDVNSMYPAVMRNALHPLGQSYAVYNDAKYLTAGGFLRDGKMNRPYFLHFTGANRGALPTRTKDGLTFGLEYGEFFACHHEVKTALKYGLIRIDKVHSIIAAEQSTTFAGYVDNFIQEKIDGKREKNKVKELFAKLLLNSAYGKFAQNSDNYFDYFLTECGGAGIEWENYTEETAPELFADYGLFEIWRTPSTREAFFDVAVAASVTSAARAVLLEAMQNATRPVYCDTDSIICEALDGVEIDPVKLGAWDLEAEGDSLAVAGKKMYALFQDGREVKRASKGVRVSGDAIREMCRGLTVTHENDAPTFKLNGQIKFVKRRVRMLDKKI